MSSDFQIVCVGSMHSCGRACVHTHVWSPGVDIGCLPLLFPSFFPEHLFLNLELSALAHWPANTLQGPSHLHLPSVRDAGAHLAFLCAGIHTQTLVLVRLALAHRATHPVPCIVEFI